PYFRKLQMEGESGRKKMNQMTRWLTLVIICIQGPAYMAALHSQIPAEAFLAVNGLGWSPFAFNLISTLILMAGSMFVMWLGERITDRGIGNGISLIIMIGIVARLPYALVAEGSSKLSTTNGGMLLLLVEFLIWFFVVIAAIALVQAVRRVPVQYAKRVIGNRQFGGVRQYIPLKINAAGVMPIIFAQALMLFPLLFSRFDATRGLAATLGNYTGFWYNFIFGLLVVIFTYFYTAVTVNPTMMAEDMKKNGGFIPGVKPGKKTVEYLDDIMSRVTLPGSIFLAFIAILPAFAMKLGVNNQFASFYGGTSLLILVGVVLDTLQQIESYLLMRHYDGLMKTGRLSGRSGM
ncbi:MAG: preprotein translocase subunit SecY, partial [Bacteroidales bacterium]|nr:preprotein translocase subunit SecY [Bacteroidales bacterium]